MTYKNYLAYIVKVMEQNINELKDLDKSINAELEKKKVEKKSSRVSNKKMPVTSTSKSGKSITVVKASSKVARKTRGGKKTASKTTQVK